MGLLRAGMKVSASWQYRKTNTGFNYTTQRDDLTKEYNAAVGTYTQAHIAEYTLAAAGTQTIDLYTFVSSITGEAITATKCRGLVIVAEPVTPILTGGQLKIEPGGLADPVSWSILPAAGLTFDIGITQAFFCLCNGLDLVIGNTAKNVKLSNPGSKSVVVDVFFLIGP